MTGSRMQATGHRKKGYGPFFRDNQKKGPYPFFLWRIEMLQILFEM
jgi:hypothetical protein